MLQYNQERLKMKSLRKESINFYTKILEHKTSDNTATISSGLFDGSQSSFYKKLDTLQKHGCISILNRSNGLINLKINNDYGIKINKRNTNFKHFVKLTNQQQTILKKLKNEQNELHTFRPTVFCKKYNICTKTIVRSLMALQKNGAITLLKTQIGVFSISINDTRVLGEKSESDVLGIIYAIQNTTSKNIKIGFTTKDINYRLKQLQTGNENKLQLLYSIDGSFKTESSIHKEFKDLRLEGEWFRFDERITEFFNSHSA